MKNHRLFWLLTAPFLTVPFSSGCMFLKAPEPQPIPTAVPTPKPPYFDPAAGQPRGIALNAANDPKLPEAFRIAAAVTGDTVAVQSVDIVQVGKPPKDTTTIGPADNVKLAGIVAPTVDPGLQGARTAITRWTAGQDLTMDIDKVFPYNTDGMRVVHVFFKGGKGPYEGQVLSLNRMLVRSGWAVVDLYSPTSFDTSQWLLDEAYARDHKLGFWKYGMAIQQRVPIKIQPPKGKVMKTSVIVVPNAAAKTTTTQTTKVTTTTTATTTTTPPATSTATPAP